MQGYVYVLMSPAFPTLLKIGRTTKNPQERANELSTTGSPEKFVVVHSVMTNDCVFLEQSLHEHYKEKRYSQNREFFEVSVADAIKKIEELVLENNLFIDSIEPIQVEKTVEVLLYEITFGDNHQAKRVGLIKASDCYAVNGEGFVMPCSANTFLESNDFKNNLTAYYEKTEPTGFLKHQLLYFENFKVVNTELHKIGESFYENANNLIAQQIQQTVGYAKIIKIYPDKQSMYNSGQSFDGIWDCFSLVNIDFVEESFRIEDAINTKKTIQAKNKFDSLLINAPIEVVNYWKKYLQTQGWGVNQGGFHENDGVDYSNTWEKYSNMLILDIERTNLMNEFKGKV
jgi:hypothetical protein